MLIGRSLPLAVLLLLGAPHAGRADDQWARLRQTAHRVRTISAGFVQHKRLPILARPIESRGTFHFQAPDSMRWEYSAPVRTVSLLCRGKARRFTWSQTTNRLVEDASGTVEAMRVVLDRISSWLAGRFDADPAFAARLEPGPPTRVFLTPRQKAMAGIIQRVEITLSERAGVVGQVTVVENEQSSTVIRFENVQLNQPVDKRLFEAPERPR